VGSGAWPFLVGGVICLVNSVNERDLNLLNSCANPGPFAGDLSRGVFGIIMYGINFIGVVYGDRACGCVSNSFLEGLFASLASGRMRQKQVCDALRCSGLHARYNDVRNEYYSCPDGVG
jgi:hypothetical protein